MGKKGFSAHIGPVAAIAAFFIILSGLVCSCSQAAPRISAVSPRLVYRMAGEKPVERLSLFIIGTDDDGAIDLDELHVLNDDEQLYWSLGSGDWISAEESGDIWIGSNSLAMADDARFPRGQYRIVLIDKGGQRAERAFSLDQSEAPLRSFPSLSISDGRYRVVSSYPKNSLVAYDASGAVSRTVPLESLSGTVAALSLPASVRSAALWAADDDRLVAALTGPVPLKPLDEGPSRP